MVPGVTGLQRRQACSQGQSTQHHEGNDTAALKPLTPLKSVETPENPEALEAPKKTPIEATKTPKSRPFSGPFSELFGMF